MFLGGHFTEQAHKKFKHLNTDTHVICLFFVNCQQKVVKDNIYKQALVLLVQKPHREDKQWQAKDKQGDFLHGPTAGTDGLTDWTDWISENEGDKIHGSTA